MTLPYRDINVQVAPEAYIFTSPSSPNAPALIIDRPTGDIRLNDISLISGRRISRVSSIAGILGVISLRLDKYIIIITKAEPIGRLKGHTVYKIISTDLLPLRERQIHHVDEDRFLGLLRNFIKSGPVYFSYELDLTSSFQRQSQHDPASPLWTRTDDRFFWNRFIQSSFIDFRTRGGRGHSGPQSAIDPFILPVMFGMLEIHATSFKSTPITLALITRRSRHRAGTRYFSRGLDDDGHVSNYNETEQLVVLNDKGTGLGGFVGSGDMQSGKFGISDGKETQILAYVQTRGSVPAFWAEVNNLKYTPTIQVRGIESALSAARAHFDEQIRLYGHNYLVNLVNQKGREARIKQAYEQMVQLLLDSPKEHTQADQFTDEKFHVMEPGASTHSHLNRLHYIYFDFHSETKGMQMQRAQMLVDRMQDALVAQQYFRAADMPASQGRLEVRSLQTSVIRTNCMDCLDRTNVVQSMFARWTLDRILQDVGLMQPGSHFAQEDPALELLFRNLWADNADLVALSYSGTGAMKTDLTRLGVRTKAGALRDANVAVARYVRNNFLDGPRQDAFDLFLGAYRPDATNIGNNLVFADRRPVLIQSIPYMAAFSFFLVLVGICTPRSKDSAVWPMRLFISFWIFTAFWTVYFILNHGMLYVNWPKLNPRPWATEGYHETISKVRRDKVLGPFVATHERGLSTARYLNAEEGKKRIE